MSDLILTRTPLRLSFLGGGSDLPLYTDTGRVGCTLSGTIDRYLYVMARRRRDSKILAHYSRREEVSSLDDLQNEYIREALRWVGWDGGIEISSQADVGVRSGLGGSGAFLVGLLGALYLMRDGTRKKSAALAEEAFQLESGPLGKKTGRQDHYAAALGGFRRYRFYPEGRVTHRLFLSPHWMEGQLLLLYTGQERGDQGEAIQGDLHQERSLRRVLTMYALLARKAEMGVRMIEENSSECWVIPLLMEECWRIKKRSSGLISSPNLDAIYREVQLAGAQGGKLCGTGGGGYFLFYCPDGREGVMERLGGKYQDIPFRFTEDGMKILLEA